MTIGDNILAMLQHFRNRPQMWYAGDYDGKSIAIYLQGYIEGLSRNLERNLHSEIRLWYMAKNEINSCNLGWTGTIEYHNKGKSIEELRLLYVDTLIDFFTENPIL